MKTFFFLLTMLLSLNVQAQATSAPAKQAKKGANAIFAETIIEERLKRHLLIIASDAMEGRETGQPGIEKAAKYIKARLENYNLPPFGVKDEGGKIQYEQPFSYHKERWGERTVKVNDVFLTEKDYYSDIRMNTDLSLLNVDKVLFLGYGIQDEKYNDYAGVSAKGKTIIIFDGEPKNKQNNFLISNSSTPSKWTENELLKYEIAFKHGVELVLVIKSPLSEIRPRLKSRWQLGEGLLPKERLANNIQISDDAAKLILGRKYKKLKKYRRKILKKGKSKHFKAKTSTKVVLNIDRDYLYGANLLTIIEGSDPKLKDEYIFISAHYDHLGKRGDEIYNGADDNGSGTSALIEIAHAFAQAKKAKMGPKRSIVVMWMAGEEKGLLGSAHYVESPLVPLKSTVADINIDMIGRIDDDHKENPDYIYVIGADRLSTDLDKIVKSANKHINLDLDYKFNADDDPNRFYFRSDHYNFAKNNIPSVFFFNGTHDDYHRASDTVDKINFEKMTKVAKLTFYTAWEIANRTERLKVDVSGRN